MNVYRRLTSPPEKALTKRNPENARIIRITADDGTEVDDAGATGTIRLGKRAQACSQAKEVYNP